MSSDVTILRGRLLWFDREPVDGDDSAAFHFHEDGALVMADGHIIWSGDWNLMPDQWRGVNHTDHRGKLIMPGFIDCHLHFPQGQVVASYAGSLLEWLNTYTFVEEQKYGDAAFAARMAAAFLDMLVAHGTTTCVAFGSVHKTSCDMLFAEAESRNMRIIAGKVMMDCHAPGPLTDTAQSGYDDTKQLIADWHGRGRLGVAITPRFALTSSPAQLEASGALVAEHPDCLMQTHLSENHAEIARAMELYPQAKDYTDIYDHYGLLTANGLFGHCIHLSPRERARMAETGAVAVFCPTSNLFLGSGSFDLASTEKAGQRHAIATDIGGGTSWSMLRTLDEGYKIHNGLGYRYQPLRSFYQATKGNAAAIGMGDRIGSLAAGMEADVIVLDACATPAMALRMETVETLSEELFVLQTMGDDRAIAATYVSGVTAKPA